MTFEFRPTLDNQLDMTSNPHFLFAKSNYRGYSLQQTIERQKEYKKALEEEVKSITEYQKLEPMQTLVKINKPLIRDEFKKLREKISDLDKIRLDDDRNSHINNGINNLETLTFGLC